MPQGCSASLEQECRVFRGVVLGTTAVELMGGGVADAVLSTGEGELMDGDSTVVTLGPAVVLAGASPPIWHPATNRAVKAIASTAVRRIGSGYASQ